MAKKEKVTKEEKEEDAEGCPECGALYGSRGCGLNEDDTWRCGPAPEPEPEPEPESAPVPERPPEPTELSL
jgi:hypothetical protein|tara:strand:+ start:440 stop:652 length:213 start_codon:yes stop_codon:yes gene_type:complete